MNGSEPWRVVRVPFPYADRPVRKHRPALVIAGPPSGIGPALVWVLMITSAENAAWPGDVAVTGLTDAGLPAASVVRTAKVATVDARQVEAIGWLPTTDRAPVAARLRAVLDGALV